MIVGPHTGLIGGQTMISRFMVLRYVEEFLLDPGSATDTVVYNLNGMYDPRVATGGHQPTGFDTQMGMYNRFLVEWCRVTISIMNTGPDQSASECGLLGGLITQTGSDISAGTPYNQIAEQPFYFGSQIPPGSRSSPWTNIAALVKLWQWFGCKRNQLAQAEYFGSGSANPSRGMFVEIAYHSPNGNTVENPVYGKVQLDYGCRFSLPRQSTYSSYEEKQRDLPVPPVRTPNLSLQQRRRKALGWAYPYTLRQRPAGPWSQSILGFEKPE